MSKNDAANESRENSKVYAFGDINADGASDVINFSKTKILMNMVRASMEYQEMQQTLRGLEKN